MSNTIKSVSLVSPFRTVDAGACFTIDTPATPFLLQGVCKVAGEYVFSGWIKADTTATIEMGTVKAEIETDWTRVVIPLLKSSSDTEDVAIYFNTVTTYYMYHAQLEMGNKSTKWQPSPDDVQESVDAVNVSIDKLPDKILSTVEKTYNGKKIISTINQTAEAVAINADKINLNGAVTANSNFKILKDGSMEAQNGKFTGEIVTEGGIKIVGGDGALSMFSFSSKAGDPQTFGNGIGGFNIFGYGYDMDSNNNITFYKTREVLEYYIPSNFIITNAVIAVKAAAIKWSNGLGYPRQIKIYSTDKPIIAASFASLNQYWSYIPFTDTGTPITGFNGGLDEWTPSLSNNTSVDSLLTQDIHNYINNGAHSLVFQCNTGSINTNDMDTANLRTGLFRAFLYVSGYLKVE